jgi:hypothetical protein
MASITVTPLTTTNTAPMLTGTVQFERFDSNLNPKQTIQVEVNYNRYNLFKEVGLDETVTPNIWKLHFPESFVLTGTYEVEARVIDIATGDIIAKDSSVNELTIKPISIEDATKNNMSLLQKVALLSSLMNTVQKSFGGQNGIGGNPAVHPTLDDDSTTSLAGRGDQERGEDPRAKDKKKRQQPNKNPVPPKKHPFAAVDSAALEAAPEIEPPTSADILSQMGKSADADTALTDNATQAVRSAPDTGASTAVNPFGDIGTSLG